MFYVGLSDYCGYNYFGTSRGDSTLTYFVTRGEIGLKRIGLLSVCKQWGKHRTDNTPYWSDFTVSFPIAFPDTPLNTQVTVGGSWEENIECSVKTVDKTALTFYYFSSDTHYASWMVIGI